MARDRLLWAAGRVWVESVGLVGDGVIDSRWDALELGMLDERLDQRLMRPILSGADHLQGTVADGRFYVVGAGAPWAIIVIVGTADARHAVLVPVLEDPKASAYFLDFLESPASEVSTRAAVWKEHFEVSSRIDRFHWPAAKYHAEGV